MPKRSMITPSHSTTEKQNTDFGRFTDNYFSVNSRRFHEVVGVAAHRCGLR